MTLLLAKLDLLMAPRKCKFAQVLIMCSVIKRILHEWSILRFCVIKRTMKDSEQIQTKIYWFEKFNEQRKLWETLKEPR